MNFYLLNDRSDFADQAIDAYHSVMFHGLAERGGQAPTRTDYRMEFPLDSPMRIHKNVFELNDVFIPEYGKLVVSGDVLKRVCTVTDSIGYRAVEFTKKFSVPYAPFDFSQWETINSSPKQRDFIDRQVNDESLSVPTYYELIVPDLEQIREDMQSGKWVDFKDQVSEYFDDDVELVMSEEAMNQYPILFWCGFFVSELLMEELSPFLEEYYFEITKIVI